MTLSAAQLLKNLQPAVRPMTIAPPGALGAPIESQSFGELLALAKSGKIASGREIQLSFDAQPPIDSAQLERLSAAADQAEAAGAQQALLIIDGRSFVLDVQARTLTAELLPATPMQIVNIDTVLHVPDDKTASTSSIPPPSAGVLNPSIASSFTRQS